MVQQKIKAVMSWSTGKDSAYAFHLAQQSGRYDIVGLMTTIKEGAGRVAAHGTPEALLDAQIEAVGLSAYKVHIPRPCPNSVYEARIADVLLRLKAEGVTHVIYGDLFLADIKAYRERQMQALGLQAVFPLWGKDTTGLAHEMLDSGLRTVLVCVNIAHLDASFAGQELSRDLLQVLPDSVDPCGENGEFHSAVVAGPMLKSTIPYRHGALREENGFVYCDIEPVDERRQSA